LAAAPSSALALPSTRSLSLSFQNTYKPCHSLPSSIPSPKARENVKVDRYGPQTPDRTVKPSLLPLTKIRRQSIIHYLQNGGNVIVIEGRAGETLDTN
jgi:hypothetical protein